MADDSDRPDYFQHRWGVKEWDVGATTIPNPILVYYSRVPWTDKNGKRGRGITNQEMLCIIHLASFHYESEKGESRPAIGTVARRMGYRKDDSVRGLIKSLEHKNLLTVERRPGKCSIYDFSNLSRAILKLDQGQPPHPNGDHSSGGLSDGGHSNGPHSQGDEEEKSSKEEKQKEEKKKEKESDSALSENPATAQPSAATSEGGDDDEDPSIDRPHGRGSRGTVLDIGVPRPTEPDNDADALPDGRGDDASAGVADPIVEAVIAQTETHPDQFDLGRNTVAERQKAGGNYADPPPAGGDDALVEAAITSFCGGKPPKRSSGTWHDMTNTLQPIHADWGLHDMEVGEALGIITAAIALFLEEKQQMAVYKYPSFAANYGHYLSRAMNGDDRKGAKHGPHKRHIADGAVKRQVATEEEARAILGDRCRGP